MAIYTWTGNPFVDAGISAILEWFEKKQPPEIEKGDLILLSKDLQDLYLTQKWQKNLYSVFPNHPVTQSFGIKTKNL